MGGTLIKWLSRPQIHPFFFFSLSWGRRGEVSRRETPGREKRSPVDFAQQWRGGNEG